MFVLTCDGVASAGECMDCVYSRCWGLCAVVVRVCAGVCVCLCIGLCDV